MKVGRSYRFEAAHFLPNVPEHHKCRNMHGHNYRVEVTIAGQIDERGFVMDFCELDAIVKPLVEKLDHKVINSVIENPTAEMIATWFKHNLGKSVPSGRLWVRVYETENGWAEA